MKVFQELKMKMESLNLEFLSLVQSFQSTKAPFVRKKKIVKNFFL